MMHRWLVVLLSAVLATPSQAPPPSIPDRELETGIQQAQEGDFEAAILTLDSAVRRLSAAGNRPRDLSRAYMYLATAYLGLAQEQSAKAKFLEALKANRELELSAKELPPQYLKFFEQVRKDALATGAVTPPPSPKASPTPVPVVASRTPQKGGGGSKKVLIGAGVLALVGGGVAVAGGGGGNSGPPSTTPTTTPAPVTTTTTPGDTSTTTTSTTQPTTSTTTPGTTTTTTTTTTATTTPTTTTTTTMAPSCPTPRPPDVSGVVSGGTAPTVTCEVGAGCTVTELGLRFAGGARIGFDTGNVRIGRYGWNPCNPPGGNGTHTLQCYVNFQGGASTSANSQVTVQGCPGSGFRH